MSSWAFWNKKCVTISEYDPTYKVVYLGNVLTPWAKGEGSVEKPLTTLWKNYCSNVKQDMSMKVTICSSGLKAFTKEHGLTEYWASRITFCTHVQAFPRLFCWVYRHEGKRMKQELRCHAVLCQKEESARVMVVQLNHRLVSALQEFRREKLSRQKARLSLGNDAMPRRKVLLCTGTTNFRAPLERSRSAPKLMAIEENLEEPDDDEDILTGSESDVVTDADLDSLSDHYATDSVDDMPDPQLRPQTLNSIDEATDDNISDESGYAEEKV